MRLQLATKGTTDRGRLSGVPSWLGALVLTACSYSAEQIPIGVPDDYDVHTSTRGVSIGAEPIATKVDSERYLGTDVTEKLYPVFVVIETKSDEVKIVERAEQILAAEGGLALHLSLLGMKTSRTDEVVLKLGQPNAGTKQ